MTSLDLAAIKRRAEASAGVAGFATIHYALAREDVPALIAEVRRLRAELSLRDPSIPVECCASGSCEVCRPGSGWAS